MKTNPGIKALVLIASLLLLIPISKSWYSFLARSFSDTLDASDTHLEYRILTDSTVKVNKYWHSNKKFVVIPNKVRIKGNEHFVTSIGYEAFYNCYKLTNIKIPESVTSIENSAFSGCTQLTNINIPTNLKSFGESVFYGCSNLNNIEIPASVESIGESAFHNCISLINIKIPKSVNSIGNYAFEGCSNLNVVIDNSKDKVIIGKDAFKGCKSVRYTK